LRLLRFARNDIVVFVVEEVGADERVAAFDVIT